MVFLHWALTMSIGFTSGLKLYRDSGSLDFNPCETIWAVFARKLSRSCLTKTKFPQSRQFEFLK